MASLQLPLFKPTTEWKPPAMGYLPSWRGARRIGYDTETKDPWLRELGPGVRRGGHIVGVSFAIEDGPAFYLPIRHEGGDNLPEELVLAYLREQAREYRGEIVGAHLAYDLDYSAEEGVIFNPDVKFRDVLVADPLIDENQDSYSLEAVATRHGLPGKEEAELNAAAAAYGVSPKDGLWRLPGRFAGVYGAADARRPLQVLRRQEKLIDDNDLWDIWNLETDVLPVLVRMRRRGIRVDQDRLEQIETWSVAQEREALDVVYTHTGIRIALGGVWEAKALAPVLEEMGVKVPRTPKTNQPSINKELLAGLGSNPVAEALLRARKVNKIRTTFAAGVRKHLTNGRLHCTFNQIALTNEDGESKGVRYGRLSCGDPNLQQQPNPEKKEWGDAAKEWRKIYMPEEGSQWGCADVKQQEPYWVTHYAALIGLPGAQEAAQAYHDNPKIDNHQFMADLTGLPRARAKLIFLGLCYGEGGATLCNRDLGLPTRWAIFERGHPARYFASSDAAYLARGETGGGRVFEVAGEEGQEVLDTFDRRAPYIRQLAKKASERAGERGYIITIGGRKLHFPRRTDGSYDWLHKALNRLIQGSSADQIKKALVEIDRAGHYLQLQVHDDVNSSVSGAPEALAIGEIIVNAYKALVPFRTDVEVGPSWGELEKVV